MTTKVPQSLEKNALLHVLHNIRDKLIGKKKEFIKEFLIKKIGPTLYEKWEYKICPICCDISHLEICKSCKKRGCTMCVHECTSCDKDFCTKCNVPRETTGYNHDMCHLCSVILCNTCAPYCFRCTHNPYEIGL